MTTIYVKSTTGSHDNDGLTWATAKASLASGAVAAGASGIIYVSQSHLESFVSLTVLGLGATPSTMLKIYCVDDSSEPPVALANTALLTSSNGIAVNGSFYMYGVSLQSGRGGTGGTLSTQIGPTGGTQFIKLEDCSLILSGTGTGNRITFGPTSNSAFNTELHNVRVGVTASGQAMEFRGKFLWADTSGAIMPSSTVPSVLMTSVSTPFGCGRVVGVDFSNLASSSTLVNIASSPDTNVVFENCKMGPNSLTTGVPIDYIPGQVKAINCSSGNANYKYTQVDLAGTVTDERTVVLDAFDGANLFSRKMVSSQYSHSEMPLSLDLATWNDTVNSQITVTVDVVTDGVTLNDEDCYLEVEYLYNGSFPISTFANDNKVGPFATGVAQTTSTANWTTTGLSSPVKQKLEVSVTPSMSGVIYGKVNLTKLSTTVYVNPKMVIT